MDILAYPDVNHRPLIVPVSGKIRLCNIEQTIVDESAISILGRAYGPFRWPKVCVVLRGGVISAMDSYRPSDSTEGQATLKEQQWRSTS
jgi:hypothetical protein